MKNKNLIIGGIIAVSIISFLFYYKKKNKGTIKTKEEKKDKHKEKTIAETEGYILPNPCLTPEDLVFEILKIIIVNKNFKSPNELLDKFILG